MRCLCEEFNESYIWEEGDPELSSDEEVEDGEGGEGESDEDGEGGGRREVDEEFEAEIGRRREEAMKNQRCLSF